MSAALNSRIDGAVDAGVKERCHYPTQPLRHSGIPIGINGQSSLIFGGRVYARASAGEF